MTVKTRWLIAGMVWLSLRGLSIWGVAEGLVLLADEAVAQPERKTIRPSAGVQPIQFNRDIRPILADACFRCHGSDAHAREADLRLDHRADAVSDRGDYKVIAPGKPADSELIARITSQDDLERMPPPEARRQLSKQEINLLRRWIEQGAPYQKHWAFIPPKRPKLPSVERSDWSRNGIDRFVLARLECEGQHPSPEADKATLIRRVTLDLTGLPPTLEEVDAFLADSSPNAYEAVVDRLLQSQRYGEQMARYWLDAARYADTNGYFADKERIMWPWRDWVIRAFNDNMPFDQFTIEQLAGDLLPDANQSQKIASGFNRNHMINNESGSIPEEFRVEYVADRLKTTATVWMGLTIGCARCHDHKFDPISQRDFYRLFAFFNNVPEKGIDGAQGNAVPLLSIPTPEQKKTLAALDARLTAAQKVYDAAKETIASQQSVWEKKVVRATPAAPSQDLLIHYPFDGSAADDGPFQFHGQMPVEASFVPGVMNKAVQLANGEPVTVSADLPIDTDRPFSCGAWVYPASSAGCILSKTDDSNAFRGFDLTLRKGRLLFHLIHRWKDDAMELAVRNPIPSRQWSHLFVTYDGSGKAEGVKIFIDGNPQPLDVQVDRLAGSIANKEPLRIGRRKSSASFEGKIDELRMYGRTLTEEEVFALATGQLIRGVAARPMGQRDPHLAKKLTDYYLDRDAPQTFREQRDRVNALEQKRAAFAKTIPTMMVMQEMKEPRPTFVLVRGAYDRPGEPVHAGVPACLGEFPQQAPHNRLGLAQWLTSRDHPLTARVTVNRIWQQFFGTGIVRTTEDFGVQGEWPSHPELLDWLAVEFIESGWNVKQLVRQIVLSSTYRQSSFASRDQYLEDPLNRKLARGPRFRLDAECIRDQALAISGLLVERIGGPSVKPYQPPGLWRAVSYDGELGYVPSTGGDLHRRSLYSFWKRQSPPPNMLAFDAGSRETCSVRRSRTNTPLQALVLMNDPVFIEAARGLALRTLDEAPQPTAENRARYAFRLATARYPDTEELKVLTMLYDQQLQRYRTHPQAARQLIDSVESDHSPVELAAWTAVSNLILSLDETITKN